jgi:hypothetical protein
MTLPPVSILQGLGIRSQVSSNVHKQHSTLKIEMLLNGTRPSSLGTTRASTSTR